MHQYLHLRQLTVGIAGHSVRDVTRECVQNFRLFTKPFHLLIILRGERLRVRGGAQTLSLRQQDGAERAQHGGQAAQELAARSPRRRHARLQLASAQRHQLTVTQRLKCSFIILVVELIEECHELAQLSVSLH